MSVTATTPEELSRALKSDAQEIAIEGDFVRKVIRIRATGKVAWAVAIGAIVCVVYAIIATVGSGGTSPLATVPASFFGFTAATGVLGVAAAKAAVSIAVAAGGVAALSKLRKYKEVSRSDNRLVLKRR